jgi:hypothetical protein
MIVHTDESKSGRERGKFKVLNNSKSTGVGGCVKLVGMGQL